MMRGRLVFLLLTHWNCENINCDIIAQLFEKNHELLTRMRSYKIIESHSFTHCWQNPSWRLTCSTVNRQFLPCLGKIRNSLLITGVWV